MILQMVIGFCAGIISGMGIGGGTILIPALHMFLQFSQHMAQGINLIYFIPTAIAALIVHKKNHMLKTQPAFWLIVFGVFGAAAGALCAVHLQDTVLRKLFGIFLLIMGVYELCKGFRSKSVS